MARCMCTRAIIEHDMHNAWQFHRSNEPFWFKRASRSLSAIVPRTRIDQTGQTPLDPLPLVPTCAHLCGDVKLISICWLRSSHELLSLDASGITRLSFHKDAHERSTRLPIRNRNQFAETDRQGIITVVARRLKKKAILESMIIGLILMTLRFS